MLDPGPDAVNLSGKSIAPWLATLELINSEISIRDGHPSKVLERKERLMKMKIKPEAEKQEELQRR